MLEAKPLMGYIIKSKKRLPDNAVPSAERIIKISPDRRRLLQGYFMLSILIPNADMNPRREAIVLIWLIVPTDVLKEYAISVRSNDVSIEAG